ncbi:MAG: hypothetical protein ACRD0V_21460 [Acidimicrobiales bacterium]
MTPVVVCPRCCADAGAPSPRGAALVNRCADCGDYWSERQPVTHWPWCRLPAGARFVVWSVAADVAVVAGWLRRVGGPR